jgi:hypothetical protein
MVKERERRQSMRVCAAIEQNLLLQLWMMSASLTT